MAVTHSSAARCILTVALWTCMYSSALDWRPQMGTVRHPKIPELSTIAKAGDVFNIDGLYYKALTTIDPDAYPEVFQNLPQNKNEYWRRIRRGTYLLPKRFKIDTKCDAGDIYYDEDDGTYYRVEQSGTLIGEWKSDVSTSDQSPCTFDEVNDKENWMSLLRPEIGDTRLGDILIPGSHDSGTSGIDEDSILVDQNVLFKVGIRLDPQFIANWSLTHPDKFDQQLLQGFRNFDLRIADTVEQDGQFRWWHGMSGDEITEGLDFIGEFASGHPEEVLILDFGHFAAPGNALNPTLPISQNRLDVLSDMILARLGDSMTFRSQLSTNPTFNEILSTGRNLITIMHDSYIRNKDGRYWESIIHSSWVSKSNPEELFEERSGKLQNFKNSHPDEITDLSGCTTADEKIIIAALVNVYGDNETIQEIIDEIVPGLPQVNPTNMSFEGLWVDLLSKGTYGTITDGMFERPDDLYTNGASVQYSGVNDQARHWVARPDLYKPNIIYTDDFESSTLVDIAIQASSGNIVREVSVAHQGTPKSGYFEWAGRGFSTVGGTDGLECESVNMRYTISNQDDILFSDVIVQNGKVDFEEGFYPPTATVDLDVMSEGSMWQPLWSGNLQSMIDSNYDVYIRGTDLGAENGFAYMSTVYNDYGEECQLPPFDQANVVVHIEW